MKKVIVLTNTMDEAATSALELLMMIEESLLVKSYKFYRKGVVKTPKVTVEFVPRQIVLDGMTCDVPVGFGAHGKVMARNREYPELNSVKDIAKYILDMELGKEQEESKNE